VNLMSLSAKTMPMSMAGDTGRALGANASVVRLGGVSGSVLGSRSIPDTCHFGRWGCRFGRYIGAKERV